MYDVGEVSNQDFVETTSNESGEIVKQCYFLEGKFFIVIHKSIADKLGFPQDENRSLYFREEITAQGDILLRNINTKKER